MGKQASPKKGTRLYLIIAALPPSIILLYLYARNYREISFPHILIVDAVFTLLTLAIYLILARALARRWLQGNGTAALVCLVVWIVFIVASPVYNAMASRLTRPLRYAGIVLMAFAAIAGAFMLFRKIRRKEIYILVAVFEAVLLMMNLAPSLSAFLSNDDGHRLEITIAESDFTVDTDTPSPNIYWLFTDGMLGFRGVETLFGDAQAEFAAQLETRGFVINRDARFEAFHGTVFATPSLFSPGWYDAEFMPLLTAADLSDYDTKMRMRRPHTAQARINNELIAAFNAKGYTTNYIAGFAVNMFTWMQVLSRKNYNAPGSISSYGAGNLALQKLQAENLNLLLVQSCGPWVLVDDVVLKILNMMFREENTGGSYPVSPLDKHEIYGDAYINNSTTARDTWYADALYDIFQGSPPRLVILYDAKSHYPFLYNEDGSGRNTLASKNDPSFYLPAHRFAAKLAVSYIDLILRYDPDAIIVVQADHGLHHEDMRKMLLAEGKTDEDIRLAQNQTMSAVRIPAKWGGLDAPLDPLNIARVLVNRYVGPHYPLLESHP